MNLINISLLNAIVRHKDCFYYIDKLYKTNGVYDDAVVHLPFKRDFEKQTHILFPINKKYLDASSYWIEDVAYKLMCKFIRDNGFSFDDFEVREYIESDYD